MNRLKILLLSIILILVLCITISCSFFNNDYTVKSSFQKEDFPSNRNLKTIVCDLTAKKEYKYLDEVTMTLYFGYLEQRVLPEKQMKYQSLSANFVGVGVFYHDLYSPLATLGFIEDYEKLDNAHFVSIFDYDEFFSNKFIVTEEEKFYYKYNQEIKVDTSIFKNGGGQITFEVIPIYQLEDGQYLFEGGYEWVSFSYHLDEQDAKIVFSKN